MKTKKTWNYTVKQCPLLKLEDFINGMDNMGYDLVNLLYRAGEFGDIIQVYKSREDIFSPE